MKAKCTILFRVGAILLLLIIAGIMVVVGHGHTVYIDSRSTDYNGQTYTTPYEVAVYVDGEQVVRLRDRERDMTTCTGQTFKMTLKIIQERDGDEEVIDMTVSLPRHVDDIAINLLTYLAGLPGKAYLSEFQVAPEVVEEEGEPSPDKAPTDGMPSDI